MKSIIVKYYEGLVENHDPLDEKKVMAYQDLEKLYRNIKKYFELHEDYQQ